MAKKIWKDHDGNVVPFQYVPKLDKEKERIALKVHKKAADLNKRLSDFKADALKECDAVYNQMLKDYNVSAGKKGNYTVSTFDKEIKIDVSVQERVEFDDLIQVAQEKINEYLEEKTGGIDEDLRQIINLAFKTTKGQMDVKRVLGLFKLNIKHKKWIEAMDVLKKSINRNVSKRYLRVWQKNDNGEYKAIDLNFSSI